MSVMARRLGRGGHLDQPGSIVDGDCRSGNQRPQHLRRPAVRAAFGAWAVCAVLVISTAGAAPVITGNIDLSTIPDPAGLPCLTFQGASPAGKATAPPPVSPEQAEMQAQLAEMQADLADLAPGSAEYQQMKGLLDMAKQALGASAPRAAAPAGKAIAFRKLSAKQAVGNLYTSLAYEVSPVAWQKFLNAGALADPNKARATATVAVIRGKPLAAVAAYLKVLEKRPNDPDALYNLGALAAFLNAPNEALALLAASEAKGGPTGTFYPPKAQLLSTRGYALMQVGQSAEAAKVLRAAVQLAPNLVEAHRNLAAALGNQGQCAQAKQSLARAYRRNPAAPTKAPPPSTPQVVDGTPADARPQNTRPLNETPVLARDVLDFSRGKVGKWPYFPVQVEPDEEARLDRMIAEYEVWTEQFSALEADYRRWHDGVFDSSNYIIGLALSGSLSQPRSFLLWDAVRQYHFFPRPQNSAAEQLQAAAQTRYFRGEVDANLNLKRKVENSLDISNEAKKSCAKAKDISFCYKQAEYQDMTRRCQAVTTWNNLWRGSIASLEQPTRADVAEMDRYFTTVMSYTSETRLLAYQRAGLKIFRKQKMMIVPMAISEHLGDLSRNAGPCVFIKRNPPPSPNEALGAYSDPDDDPCRPRATAKAKAFFFEVSFNCEKVAFEIGVEVPFLDVGIFVNVEEKFSAGRQTPPNAKDRFLTGQGIVNPERIPQFGDPGQGQITTFGAGAGVKAGVSVAGSGVEGKAGFYVTGDGKGNLGDVGARVESSETVGVEVGDIGVGVEFEGPGASVSFLPSVGD